ncbi:1,2-phenylacetyl-CoA epoxidase subunit PaaD [Fervidibacillus halotolerans]|uniref:Phenylacetate-CoA oxygenase subunit PaaJ n=1 Tax=Fervidibacillus halotolerans TaxID=2980027 RepID=A0A9E8RZP7_9BACI|nr:1,2-phenylacetyl-CoA epoxidase subunit PaaD [Fervidibacillus halotolerans]WAA11852.1 phenylacetate-CoA oxygenase subunit PaaJ [Fervidibacillus halotolerans]
MDAPLKEQITNALKAVTDPEIPVVSVIDLGMIEGISVEGTKATVQVLPTFVGCPALELIRKKIKDAVEKVRGIDYAEVIFIYNPPWTSDRITEMGRKRLKEFGIAPPPKLLEKEKEWSVDCPYCGSSYTLMENVFGPTACRSIFYCKHCKNPFEAMKPVFLN